MLLNSNYIKTKQRNKKKSEIKQKLMKCDTIIND